MVDETIRASCGAMERLIQNASELNLGSEPARNVTPGKLVSRSSSGAGGLTSGHFSDVSGAIRSDDDFSSERYSDETAETSKINAPHRANDEPSCSYSANPSDAVTEDADSPGVQTLAALKTEVRKCLSTMNTWLGLITCPHHLTIELGSSFLYWPNSYQTRAIWRL